MDARYYEVYGRLQDHHWWFLARSQILSALIAAWDLAPPGGSILDVGCGTGGPLYRALRGRYRLEGIDAEPAAVEWARRQGYDEIRLGTIEEFGRGTGIRDLAMLLDVIEHVEDDVGMLRSTATALKPGGRVLVTVPALAWLWSGHDVLAHHVRRYSKALLREHLEAAGFSCERLTFFNTWLFPLAVVKKLADKVRGASAEHGYYDTPGPRLNRLFLRIFAAETNWLQRRTFPLGVSLLAVGRKPEPHTLP